MTTRFANRTAAYLWGFAVVWWALLLLMTWLVFSEGLPGGPPSALVAAVGTLFWLGGLGLAAFVASKPCSLVEVRAGVGVEVTWRYPLRAVRLRLPPQRLQLPSVVERRDGDGEPRYAARLELGHGLGIDLVESHDREACRLACERFAAALNARR